MGTELAIIDSGGANISSLLYAFSRLGIDATLTADADVIRNATRVILPGVGAARDAMQRLQAAKLVDVIRGLTQPVLGICLGMQLLCDRSHEEDVACLGIIPGEAALLPCIAGFPVPNMGWCHTTVLVDHAIFDGLSANDASWFYYLHSYAVPLNEFTIGQAEHASAFSAVLARDNFVATQFHPERSSQDGVRLLKNFMSWSP